MRVRYAILNASSKSQENRIRFYLILIILIFVIFFSFSNILGDSTTYDDVEGKLSSSRKNVELQKSLDERLITRFNSKSMISKNMKMRYEIAIIIVITQDTRVENYEIAIQTVRCYSKIHNYDFVLAVDSDFECRNEDKFFRRHCVVAKILPRYKAVLFLDADIGVVNSKKKIESFMADGIDIIFYDRFYNWEIMAGSYIARNTDYSVDFLNGFANFEFSLPDSFHGTDNGALHIYLIQKIFPRAQIEIEICQKAYNKSEDFDDLFTYEACIRSLLGLHNDFGKVRIMTKGTGWARDDWLISGKWNPSVDFMLHGWKMNQLKPTPDGRIPDSQMGTGQWYNPFAGPIILEKCSPRNSSWSYDPRLLTNKSSISLNLNLFKQEVAKKQVESYARILQLLNKNRK